MFLKWLFIVAWLASPHICEAFEEDVVSCIERNGENLQDAIYDMAKKSTDQEEISDLVGYANRFDAFGGRLEDSEKECQKMMKLSKISEAELEKELLKNAVMMGINDPLDDSTVVFCHNINLIEALALEEAYNKSSQSMLGYLYEKVTGATSPSVAKYSYINQLRNHAKRSLTKLADLQRAGSVQRYGVQKMFSSGAQMLGAVGEQATKQITERTHPMVTRSMVNKVVENVPAKLMPEGKVFFDPAVLKTTKPGMEFAQRAKAKVGQRMGIKNLDAMSTALDGGLSKTVASWDSSLGKVGLSAEAATQGGLFLLTYGADIATGLTAIWQGYRGEISKKKAIRDVAVVATEAVAGYVGAEAGAAVGEKVGGYIADKLCVHKGFGSAVGTVMGTIGGAVAGRFAATVAVGLFMDKLLGLTPYDALNQAYEFLGVSSTASNADINKAYHVLAKKYHPDKNKNDAAAEEMMTKLNTYVEVIKAARMNGHGFESTDPELEKEGADEL